MPSRKVLESSIEKPTVKYAKKRYNVDGVKMNILGRRSMPDRMLLFPGTPRWIEFKRPGEKPTQLQAEKIKQLRELGYEVEVHDNKEKAFAAIDRWWQDATGVGRTRAKTVDTPQLPEESSALSVRARRRRIIAGSRAG